MLLMLLALGTTSCATFEDEGPITERWDMNPFKQKALRERAIKHLKQAVEDGKQWDKIVTWICVKDGVEVGRAEINVQSTLTCLEENPTYWFNRCLTLIVADWVVEILKHHGLDTKCKGEFEPEYKNTDQFDDPETVSESEALSHVPVMLGVPVPGNVPVPVFCPLSSGCPDSPDEPFEGQEPSEDPYSGEAP
ncbi:MAG TPA: hypothetical protein VM580_21630 [Labilithrix sp.]|nr:hypothetical protein [Labilithrix sp.]